MDQNISMIRFLMFMILALIIFFNIAPQLVEDDSSDDNKTDAGNDTNKDKEKENETVGNYCLIDGETHKDKVCEEVSPNDSCQNRFASLEECKEWKDALAIDETEDEDGDLNYNYTTDDIDKLTIMDSDDMIYCLKNDKKCEKMKFGDCNDIHISTYLSKKNCLEAKDKIKEDGSDGDGDGDDDELYCLIGDICEKQDETNDCGDSKTYCNMNKCKKKNDVTQDEGEYCFYDGSTKCEEIDCGDICSGKYYTSLSTCKSNNGLS